MSFEKNQALTPPDVMLTRRVVGQGLFDLFEEFGLISGHEKVRLPRDRDGRFDPRVVMVKDHQVYDNKEALYPLELDGENLVRKLRPRIPQLGEAVQDIELRDVSWHSSKSVRTKFMSLRFDEETTEYLACEQEEIWSELPRIAGADPNHWELEGAERALPEPGVMVVALRKGVGMPVIEAIESHLQRRTPIQVTLLPLGDPRL